MIIRRIPWPRETQSSAPPIGWRPRSYRRSGMTVLPTFGAWVSYIGGGDDDIIVMMMMMW